jgi:enterochelin esterase family protein
VSVPEPTDVAPPHARLSLDDPEGRFRAVRLVTDVLKREPPQPYSRARPGAPWELRLPLPPVDRFEYQLQVADADGGLSLILDPRAPTATGPFGPKSVFAVPSYTPPDWLDADAPAGTVEPLELESERLGATVTGLCWHPEGTSRQDELPLLVAHDGPELAEHSCLLRYLAAAVAAGEAPPHRAALLAPVARTEHYGASGRYSAALVEELLPALGPAGPVVGAGASLGALSLLHAYHAFPDAFAGLYLQSGSFFQASTDPWETDFSRFGPISRFVGRVLAGRDQAPPIPVTITCGTAEENLANNRALRNALARQDYEVELVLVRDGHTWVGWRDAFAPSLGRLLRRAWR